MARRWTILKLNENDYAEKRKAQGDDLMKAMRRCRMGMIEVGDHTVYFVRDKDKKTISKADLLDFFDEKLVERFWEKLEDRQSEYLSLSTQD